MDRAVLHDCPTTPTIPHIKNVSLYFVVQRSVGDGDCDGARLLHSTERYRCDGFPYVRTKKLISFTQVYALRPVRNKKRHDVQAALTYPRQGLAWASAGFSDTAVDRSHMSYNRSCPLQGRHLVYLTIKSTFFLRREDGRHQ